MNGKTKPRQVVETDSNPWPFGPKNYILFAVALVVITVGFILLAMGDTTWTAWLLVIGFCALMPWAIFARPKQEADDRAIEQGPENNA
jgi:hypothetical protein